MSGYEWMEEAYQIAAEAGRKRPAMRERWVRQDQYDKDNMHTESTRFNKEQHARLRRCCREAQVTRYALISYLLRTWMAEYEAHRGGQ